MTDWIQDQSGVIVWCALVRVMEDMTAALCKQLILKKVYSIEKKLMHRDSIQKTKIKFGCLRICSRYNCVKVTVLKDFVVSTKISLFSIPLDTIKIYLLLSNYCDTVYGNRISIFDTGTVIPFGYYCSTVFHL
jgi:hypothetical protein